MSNFNIPVNVSLPPHFNDADSMGLKELREAFKELSAYVKESANQQAILAKELDWFMNGNISSQNVSNIAGYNVSKTELKHKSGIVGMSGEDAGTATAVRFWAGNATKASAPFRVQQNGKMYATDGEFTGTITGSTVTGGTVRTAATGARVEVTNGKIYVYQTDGILRLLIDSTVSPPIINWYDTSGVLQSTIQYIGSSLSIASNTSVVTGGLTGSVFGVNTSPTSLLGSTVGISASTLQINGITAYSGSVVVGDGAGGTKTLTFTKGILTNVV